MPEEVGDQENLGRGISSRKRANRADNAGIHPGTFMTKGPDISVDRLDFAPRKKMAEIADRNATKSDLTFYGWAMLKAGSVRKIKRKFHSWAVLKTVTARGKYCTVRSTPNDDNPYHASIYPPHFSSEEAKDQLAEIMDELALASVWCRWRPRPTSSL